jgi:hypothetical protein
LKAAPWATKAAEATFNAGVGPRILLSCEITNEAGNSLEASLDLPVAANP